MCPIKSMETESSGKYLSQMFNHQSFSLHISILDLNFEERPKPKKLGWIFQGISSINGNLVGTSPHVQDVEYNKDDQV